MILNLKLILIKTIFKIFSLKEIRKIWLIHSFWCHCQVENVPIPNAFFGKLKNKSKYREYALIKCNSHSSEISDLCLMQCPSQTHQKWFCATVVCMFPIWISKAMGHFIKHEPFIFEECSIFFQVEVNCFISPGEPWIKMTTKNWMKQLKPNYNLFYTMRGEGKWFLWHI